MTIRESILDEAKSLVCGDRQEQYGTPGESFGRIAALWSAYLGTPIRPHQVAACMILAKVSRSAVQPEKRDSWVDIAGYAACGPEVQHGASRPRSEAFDGEAHRAEQVERQLADDWLD